MRLQQAYARRLPATPRRYWLNLDASQSLRPPERLRLGIEPVLNSIEDIGLLPQAIRYAKAGFSVFPIYEAIDGKCSCGTKCSSPAKHPRTKTGLLEAVTVFEQIAAWWQMWPNASIGIATGPSRLVVVDIDPRHGGDASLAALEARYGAFDTPEVLTGGGGQHFYFRTIGPVKSRANALGAEFPGIDVRAEGGYVLAPPLLAYLR